MAAGGNFVKFACIAMEFWVLENSVVTFMVNRAYLPKQFSIDFRSAKLSGALRFVFICWVVTSFAPKFRVHCSMRSAVSTLLSR